MALASDEIVLAYRSLYGREPNPEERLAEQAQPDFASLRAALLRRKEARRAILPALLPERWVAAEVFGGERLIWLDPRDAYVGRGALRDDYEPQTSACARAILKPGDVFIDIGANIGWFTLLASVATGRTGRAHAFEPRRPTVDWLEKTIALNGLSDRAQVHRCGLADRAGRARLGWKPGSANPGHSRLMGAGDAEIGAETQDIALRTLDSFGLARADLIKIDVEGAEYRVLRGAEATLRRTRPRIICEIFESRLKTVSGVNGQEVFDWLATLGYRAYAIDGAQAGQSLAGPPARAVSNVLFAPAGACAIG